MIVEDYGPYAEKYSPRIVRVLFVAEAPPCSRDRYFYFEQVTQGDWLWIALMKALYPSEWGETKYERLRKTKWLQKFADSGFKLIDAVKTPITGSARTRTHLIAENAPNLIGQIKNINPEKIVLIKKTVHDALFDRIRNAGISVANEDALPFPCSGQQIHFHNGFSSLNLS